MKEHLFTHFYFSICLLSLILLIDILVNFKKPFELKIILLLISASLLLHNLTLFFNWGTLMNVSTRLAIVMVALIFMDTMYKNKLDKKILIASFIVFLCIILLFIVMDKHNIPIDQIHTEKGRNQLRYVIRSIIIGTLLYLSVTIYIKLTKSLSKNNIYSKKIENWTKLTILLFTAGIINHFLNSIIPSYVPIARSISILVQLTICILLIYRPPFINRTDLSFSLGKSFIKNILDQLDEEKFVYEFYTNQYYLRKDTYVDEFAKIMNVSAPILIEYLKEKTQLSFPDLVNKKRIDHFIVLVSSKEYANYTIEGLAELCGFGTRHSLYRYFKKFHGGNPSDLIRMYE